MLTYFAFELTLEDMFGDYGDCGNVGDFVGNVDWATFASKRTVSAHLKKHLSAFPVGRQLI